jgi:hypothetical protein
LDKRFMVRVYACMYGLCMHVCMHACLCTWCVCGCYVMHACMHACLCTWCVWVLCYVCMCVCVYAWYACMYVCMCACVFMHVHACVCVCVPKNACDDAHVAVQNTGNVTMWINALAIRSFVH